MVKKLWRASDHETWSDCASFATSRKVAELYRDNPGYGGSRLWTCSPHIDRRRVLDLTTYKDPVTKLAKLLGKGHPGAIDVDQLAPLWSYKIRELGFDWVIVPESYPAETKTWLYVGSDDFELTEVE